LNPWLKKTNINQSLWFTWYLKFLTVSGWLRITVNGRAFGYVWFGLKCETQKLICTPTANIARDKKKTELFSSRRAHHDARAACLSFPRSLRQNGNSGSGAGPNTKWSFIKNQNTLSYVLIDWLFYPPRHAYPSPTVTTDIPFRTQPLLLPTLPSKIPSIKDKFYIYTLKKKIKVLFRIVNKESSWWTSII